MQLKIFSSLAFAIMALADSNVISLLTLRSGSPYHLASVYVLDGVLSLSQNGTGVEGKILDNGKFELTDGSYLKVNSDGTLTTTTVDGASSPFSISTRYFQYQGSSGFNIDLSNSEVLFGNGDNPVALGATDRTSTDGFAPDFTPSSSDASSSSSSPAITSSGYSNSTTSTVTDNEQSTTVITVTSCSNNACSEVPITTGVTVVTTTLSGIVTEYTTYCPLTSESTTSPYTPTSTKSAVSTSTTKSAEPTTILISSSSSAVTTDHIISTFDNGAINAMSGAGLVAAVAAALLI